MQRRTRGRLIAIAPIAAALVVTTGLCLAMSFGNDRCRRTAERVRGPATTYAQDDAIEAVAPRADAGVAVSFEPKRRGCRGARLEATSMHRASVQPDRGDHHDRAGRHHRRHRSRVGWYALFMVTVLAWYAIGVAVMPWIASRARHHDDA